MYWHEVCTGSSLCLSLYSFGSINPSHLSYFPYFLFSVDPVIAHAILMGVKTWLFRHNLILDAIGYLSFLSCVLMQTSHDLWGGNQSKSKAKSNRLDPQSLSYLEGPDNSLFVQNYHTV